MVSDASPSAPPKFIVSLTPTRTHTPSPTLACAPRTVLARIRQPIVPSTNLIKGRAGMYSCLLLLPPSTLTTSLSSIESLRTPDFKRNASTDLIRQRAVERERSREASQNACPGMIKRTQFTFSVDTLLAHSRLRRVYYRYCLFV
jgi:hypothetical protein